MNISQGPGIIDTTANRWRGTDLNTHTRTRNLPYITNATTYAAAGVVYSDNTTNSSSSGIINAAHGAEVNNTFLVPRNNSTIS